jgi:hypothetical protein
MERSPFAFFDCMLYDMTFTQSTRLVHGTTIRAEAAEGNVVILIRRFLQRFSQFWKASLCSF